MRGWKPVRGNDQIRSSTIHEQICILEVRAELLVDSTENGGLAVGRNRDVVTWLTININRPLFRRGYLISREHIQQPLRQHIRPKEVEESSDLATNKSSG